MKVKLVNENFREDYLKNLLKTRGVNDLEAFLDPPATCLSDPILFDNIKEGVLLLEKILNKEDSKILIVVDADVDGYTSGAIVWKYIKAIAPSQYMDFVLHEHKQHGLQDHIQSLLDSDLVYDLIILPDSSSNDYQYHELLGEQGTRCLILDHHEIDNDQQISQYACIINNQTSSQYPNKDLTGAGVAWQFCRYHQYITGTNRHIIEDLIDLAALGICGDMGSVLSLENRYIMKHGFNNIQNYFFLCALEKQSFSMGGKINPTTVAFYIVPMMNAMIRVGSLEEKKRLFEGLIDGHKLVPSNKRGAKGTMEEVAVESLRECTNAKSKQTRITDQMVDKLEQRIYKYDLLENKILFLRLDDDDDFPSEINGLIAMKLAARFKRPAIVARLNAEGYDRGSIRNVADCELTDLKQFLNDSGFFEYVQGHANAAGASILDANLRAFHEYANEALADLDFNEGAYDVNFERSTNDRDLEDLVFELASCPEIWGQGNTMPLIYISPFYINKSDIQIIGKNNNTLKIQKNNLTYIKFFATDIIEQINNMGEELKISIVGEPAINEWNGNVTPQLLITNIEIIEDNICDF